MSLLTKIFGDANEKYLKSIQPQVDKVNELEKDFTSLTDEQLKNKTIEFRERLKKGEILDDLLPEAFAAIREASRRTLKQRHFDVQLLGGIVLHQGQVAEMRTGEGKTLTATLAMYLNALEGGGAHLVTVNDYLAKRDTVWMGQIYNALGMSIGCIQHESAFVYDETHKTQESDQERDLGVKAILDFLRPVSRKEAYLADITYGTNNEFGFDYLRDNMVSSLEQMAQRPLTYAIVDEVDSILIDEARTPLIISAPAEESTEKYYQFAKLVRILKENEDYNIDEKMRAATLTEEGVRKVEKALGVDNIYVAEGIDTVHHIEEALRAETLFKRDRDYVVKDGEVIIVDEFTGRLMFGRRYSGGLHQAIEAKENVQIQRESLTLATVSFQNYFRLYKKLSGMTGTAATEAEELHKIYGLDVTVVPTNQPMIRKDTNDLIYKTEAAKFKAIVSEIKKRNSQGQPVLVGTISIEKNELLGELLAREGIKFNLLNAKQHEKEAEIIAQAGKKAAVTIATNMAGRGVDIILGGNPADPGEAEAVKKSGGLHVIGSERHEARRIDNQLRGRSGRQGDAGSSQFFVSLDDDLMRIFGSERIKSIMTTLRVPEDMPIENALISRSIESAQRKVEGHNFDIRKHLVEYDDVLNKQRESIYRKRRQILELAEGITKKEAASEKQAAGLGEENENYLVKDEEQKFSSLSEMVFAMLEAEVIDLVNFHTAAERPSDWNIKEITETLATIFNLTGSEKEGINKILKEQQTPDVIRVNLTKHLDALTKEKFKQLAETINKHEQLKQLAAKPFEQIAKGILLRSIDTLWIEHLEAIDSLRAGIGLRGYGQRDPLIEYQRESFNLFKMLLANIQKEVVYAIFKMGLAAQVAASPLEKMHNIRLQAPAKQAGEASGQFKQFTTPQQRLAAQAQPTIITSRPRDASGHKIGRNDPCPCGSGKKYKKCHGK